MADNLVQLEISFASGGVDESAKLCWKNDAGAEQEYAVVQLRATVQQETFPGHRWVLRGQQSGNVLWEGVAAAAPAVQAHIVHVRARAGDDEAAAAGGGVGLCVFLAVCFGVEMEFHCNFFLKQSLV